MLTRTTHTTNLTLEQETTFEIGRRARSWSGNGPCRSGALRESSRDRGEEDEAEELWNRHLHFDERGWGEMCD
jgi:hypothetical protein